MSAFPELATQAEALGKHYSGATADLLHRLAWSLRRGKISRTTTKDAHKVRDRIADPRSTIHHVIDAALKALNAA